MALLTDQKLIPKHRSYNGEISTSRLERHHINEYYLPTLCPKFSPISSSFSPLDIFPLLGKFDLIIFLVLFLRRDFEPLALVEISTWRAEAKLE